jgi:hypothetical protein
MFPATPQRTADRRFVVDDLVREAVALVLELLDVARALAGALGEALQQLDQALRDGDDVGGRPVVQVEELPFSGGRGSGVPPAGLSITV